MEGLPLKEILAGLDRSQLEGLLLELAAGDQRLEAALRQGVMRRSRQPDMQRQPQPDLRALRREARAIFRGGDDYGAAGSIVYEVSQLTAQAEERLAAGDSTNALAMLEIITEAYVEGWSDFDDSDGEMGDYFVELGEVWIQALLAASLTPEERQAWSEKLDRWAGEVGDYGVDTAFEGAAEAARQGWDYPPLLRILEGTPVEPGSLDDPVDLTTVRLNVLERQGRYQEALFLARAAGLSERAATLLVRLDRVQEAVDYAREHLQTAAEALALATALYERGELDRAIEIAKHGLTLQSPRATLAGWLREVAASLGKRELALTAASAVFQEELSLAAYLWVKEFAGEHWPEQRATLLDRLRRVRSYYPSGQVDIFLHEGLVADAIAAVEGGATHTLVERVADAAIKTHPEWVIKVSQQQAESIMDAGKAQYYAAAANWLGRARDAYRAMGQEAAWQAYQAELLRIHGRKYKLVPMIQALR